MDSRLAKAKTVKAAEDTARAIGRLNAALGVFPEGEAESLALRAIASHVAAVGSAVKELIARTVETNERLAAIEQHAKATAPERLTEAAQRRGR